MCDPCLAYSRQKSINVVLSILWAMLVELRVLPFFLKDLLLFILCKDIYLKCETSLKILKFKQMIFSKKCFFYWSYWSI